ncbi:hypothetical protein Q8A73_017501 [Channa argus]|nr:hypothetical protein Q8A73_017501 [Channa argus]
MLQRIGAAHGAARILYLGFTRFKLCIVGRKLCCLGIPQVTCKKPAPHLPDRFVRAAPESFGKGRQDNGPMWANVPLPRALLTPDRLVLTDCKLAIISQRLQLSQLYSIGKRVKSRRGIEGPKNWSNEFTSSSKERKDGSEVREARRKDGRETETESDQMELDAQGTQRWPHEGTLPSSPLQPSSPLNWGSGWAKGPILCLLPAVEASFLPRSPLPSTPSLLQWTVPKCQHVPPGPSQACPYCRGQAGLLFGSDFGSPMYSAMHMETCRSGPGIKVRPGKRCSNTLKTRLSAEFGIVLPVPRGQSQESPIMLIQTNL